jgi:hypothetical protein
MKTKNVLWSLLIFTALFMLLVGARAAAMGTNQAANAPDDAPLVLSRNLGNDIQAPDGSGDQNREHNGAGPPPPPDPPPDPPPLEPPPIPEPPPPPIFDSERV